MDETGITINEACALRAERGSGYGLTDGDFARQCNPDGSVKKTNESTTISLSNSDASYTVNNSYLYGGVALLVIVVAVIVALIVRKRKAK
jgi:hypothetical protein